MRTILTHSQSILDAPLTRARVWILREFCVKSAHALQVGYKVGALLLLLDASECHLGALDVLLRVDEVLREDLLTPGDARLLVGSRVVVAIDSSRLQNASQSK